MKIFEDVDINKLSKTEQKLYMLAKAADKGIESLEIPTKKSHGMNKYMKWDFATKLIEGLKTENDVININLEGGGKFKIQNDLFVAAGLLKKLGFKPKVTV